MRLDTSPLPVFHVLPLKSTRPVRWRRHCILVFPASTQRSPSLSRFSRSSVKNPQREGHTNRHYPRPSASRTITSPLRFAWYCSWVDTSPHFLRLTFPSLVHMCASSVFRCAFLTVDMHRAHENLRIAINLVAIQLGTFDLYAGETPNKRSLIRA